MRDAARVFHKAEMTQHDPFYDRLCRIEGQAHGLSWRWELRAVNGRGLDLRCACPIGLDLGGASARRIRLPMANPWKCDAVVANSRDAAQVKGQPAQRMSKLLAEVAMVEAEAEIENAPGPAPPGACSVEKAWEQDTRPRFRHLRAGRRV